jgi:hypothetical protein
MAETGFHTVYPAAAAFLCVCARVLVLGVFDFQRIFVLVCVCVAGTGEFCCGSACFSVYGLYSSLEVIRDK